MKRFLANCLMVFCTCFSLQAQKSLSVSIPELDNSVVAEQASFQIDDGYEVNLFADESMGIANPVCMRWDPQGRLWVLCTWAYPQLKPGEKPADKLLILEDTNGDGRADKVSTFVGGLNMPTGFALGHGGAYIGNGADLIHIRDTDGDDRADAQEVLFTGFGTGDTHQNINSFTWSPGGELFFGQGLHCFSRVQTPWGIRKLDEHGSWRLRPLRRQLHSYRRTSGGGNPWGYAFGDWGEPFIKSNGSGVSELLPGLISTEHIEGGYWGGAMKIGATRIKSMIIEMVDSPHMPDDIQGDFLIAGYYARNIARLRPSSDGSGHKLQTLKPLMTSTHNAFRPVDIQTGPDGTLYVADWFNPIIGHYQASLRHPNRDKEHGRIWRISAKGRTLAKQPPIASMTPAQLCDQLAAPMRRNRQLAKLRLMDLPAEKVLPFVQAWVDSLDPGNTRYEHNLFEAIGVFESHEKPNRALLEKLLSAKEPLARAYAIRVAGRWHDRLEKPLEILWRGARDDHSRVRLETIVAASDVHKAESIAIAAQAADGAGDRFINFAFRQSVHALERFWKPSLLSGAMEFESPLHLMRVAETIGGADIAGVVRSQLKETGLPAKRRTALAGILAGIGVSADIPYLLENGGTANLAVLQNLAVSTRERGLKAPPTSAGFLAPALDAAPAIRAAALVLCGLWNFRDHAPKVKALAMDKTRSFPVRIAAAEALGFLGDPDTLLQLSTPKHPGPVRATALAALAQIDLSVAAPQAVSLLEQVPPEDIPGLLSAILQRKDGAATFAGHLAEKKCKPDTARLVLRWLNASGHDEPRLNEILFSIIGVEQRNVQYSADFVAVLSREALAAGSISRGRRIFQSPLITCTACHAVDGIPGATNAIKGPNLSAVASGLPVDLIIESVLWPGRQIKEGYEAATVVTRDGRVFNGFLQGEDKKALHIRDLTTGSIATVPRGNVAQHNKGGTMMPPGLTASLTRAELRDLIKYLTTLKGGTPSN